MGAVYTPASSDDEELFLSPMSCFLLVSTESNSIADTWVTFKWDWNRRDLDLTIWAFPQWPISRTNITTEWKRLTSGSLWEQGWLHRRGWQRCKNNDDNLYDLYNYLHHHHLILNMFNTSVLLSTRWSVSIWQQQSCLQIKSLCAD